MSRRGSPSGGARADRSGCHERRAQLVAPGARVAPADDVVVPTAVYRDDFPVSDEKHHRVRAVVGAARVLVVDPHADPPAVLKRAQRRVLLEQLLGSGLELDDRVAGIEKLVEKVVADELLVVFRTRAVFVGGHLRLSRRILASTGQRDRKSTRLNSSHTVISYAVFCLKKKKKIL